MIYLVGAGPGDSGLLTLRGYEVLKRADVIIYDRLVGEGVLAFIPENAERIDVGKIPGTHSISQSEIESLIINRAKQGYNVVRLKGGDPFVFGRGGEEAEAIINAGLKFEVVPGVSSAVAVPAYAGIPVTHRNFCSGLNIFTAHDKHNLLPDFTDSTSVFLMGVAHAKDLQEELLLTHSGETPCAIIENGTTSRERIIRTKLESLYEAAKSVNPPAVIVVGSVAALNLSWRNNLPLSHKRILITRPAGRGEKLASMLRDQGAEVILMPTIKTRIINDALKGVSLSGFDWVGFTSVTGVEALFALLANDERDIRELAPAKIAAIGPATREALRKHGLKVDYMPQIYDVENLYRGLSNFGGKILIFRALNASENIFVKEISITEHYIYAIDYVKLQQVPKFIDTVIFTSASTVRGFAANINNMREVKAVCIGIQTAKEAELLGFVDIVIAKQATEQAIFDAVMSAC